MMEFDEIVVKESPGLCRCCLSEGCYKDLSTEYTWMNETEVYADMLLECFDISISQNNDGPNGLNRLICEVCITRLRDACNFKKQVLDSEKKFVDMVGRGEFRPKVLIYQAQMKTETSAEENPDDAEIEYLEEDLDFENDELLKAEEVTQRVRLEDITVSTLPVKGKRGRPRKNPETTTTERKAKVPKLEDKPRSSKSTKDNSFQVSRQKNKQVTSDSEEETTKTDDVERIKELKILETQKKRELITLATYVLENSTALPFKWFGGNYMCFFCGFTFSDSDKLKEHTKEEHSDPSWKNLLRVLIGNNVKGVKLDITDLHCKLCLKPQTNLNDFLLHSSVAHDFKVYEAAGECLMCFKLSENGMSCLECGQNYRFFGTLLTHTHKHHSTDTPYLCEICGQRFSMKCNIEIHIRNVHLYKDTANPCKDLTQSTRKPNLKCPKCPQVLSSTYLKKKHLAFVHDVKSAQFTCTECDKIFTLKNKLEQHKLRVHKKQRNMSCDVCGFKVFNKDHLKRHMVSHNDSRPYECEFCKKKFQRKKTLEYHRRIHLNDKRYVCKDCGCAFVQHTSWKLHCRVHHSIENASWNADNVGEPKISLI